MVKTLNVRVKSYGVTRRDVESNCLENVAIQTLEPSNELRKRQYNSILQIQILIRNDFFLKEIDRLS